MPNTSLWGRIRVFVDPMPPCDVSFDQHLVLLVALLSPIDLAPALVMNDDRAADLPDSQSLWRARRSADGRALCYALDIATS